MGQLLKSKLCRYKIIISKEIFLNLPLKKAYHLKEKDGNVIFYTNEKYENEDITIIDRWKVILQKIFLNHSLMIISLILIFFLFLYSSKYVREVSFKNQNYYDVDVEKVVYKHLNKKILGYTTDVSLNELGKILRKNFPTYAYIGVLKIGAKLVIEIEKQAIYPNYEEEDGQGDIISLYDGYIQGIISTKGVVLVNTSQTVKKGDLLISGNLNYLQSPENKTNYVHAQGIILADVATYEKIQVKKRYVVEDYSGEFKSNFVFSLFNKELNSETIDNFGHIEYQEIFSLWGFKMWKQTTYLKMKMLITYDANEALSYAYSVIQYNFNLSKKNEREKIYYIDLIQIKENDDYYEISFLVKSLRNIGIFQKYSRN